MKYTCNDCKNSYHEGSFCGYCAWMCRKHGPLDIPGESKYDCNPLECEDFIEKTRLERAIETIKAGIKSYEATGRCGYNERLGLQAALVVIKEETVKLINK